MFKEIKEKVAKRFEEAQKLGKLFFVQVDRDKVWETYLNAFDEQYKQENTCNCCKSFIRQYAGIVALKDNEFFTLWDFEVEDEEYKNPVAALNKYIESRPISNLFFGEFEKAGVDRNLDSVRNIYWDHFFLKLPKSMVKRDCGPVQSEALANKDVFKRSCEELTEDSVQTVLELIAQNSIYRGQEFKPIVEKFEKLQKAYKKLRNNRHKDNFCWIEATKSENQAVSRIKNSAIGTLLSDLSSGRDLNDSVAAYERVVAPANYKRTSAVVTPKMVQSARERLEELNLIGALDRRLLNDRDLNVNNTLFVDRPVASSGDIFEEISKSSTVNPKTLKKVEEVSASDFIEKILPFSRGIKLLVENRHFPNFVSLVGPQNEGDDTLFKWNNNFSWSYSGEVADSIKERVKAAGGNVEGVLRISLSWDNTDDLDLHLYEPQNGHVYYACKRTKSKSGAVLDLDANGTDGLKENPCENIYWTQEPSIGGTYQVKVHQYHKRQAQNSGFTVEVEYNGETYHFSKKSNGNTGINHMMFSFSYSKKDGFKIQGGESSATTHYNSKEKWKIKSGQFHKVRAITLSPNYWGDNKIGNKHLFFFLEGCESDEKTRGFYNEFLKKELDKDRKVFEVLGSKVKVDSVPNELSGLGFSDTQRNEVILEVEGKFKRTIKVKF